LTIKVIKEIIGANKNWNCKGKFRNGRLRLRKQKRKEYLFFLKIRKKLT